MNRLVLILLLVACGNKDKPLSRREVMLKLPVAQVVAGQHATIPKTNLRAGEVITRTKTIRIQGLSKLDGDFVVDDQTVRTFEILEVKDGVVVQARVTYPQEMYARHVGGTREPWTPVRRGHTYLVTWRDNAAVIERDGMTPEEEKSVLGDVTGDVGVGDDFLAPFIGVPLESGRAVPLPTAEITAQFGGAATVSSAEARLLDVRPDIALVEIAYKGTTSDQQFESREVSEWSTKTGRQLKTTAAAAFFNNEFANRVDGTHTYEYRTP